MTRRTRLGVLLILLIAFLLRVYQLGAQSLWYDEGLSVHLASLPLGETIAQSAVTDHPPLHALLLNLWMSLAGSSEFSVRFVSAFFGMLVVALTYALGCKVWSRRVGLIAAGLTTIAPMAVWYGQEARGYSLLVVLVLVATLAFLRLASGDSRRGVWLAYVLSGAAALYTHYFATFWLVAINLVFGSVWLKDRLSGRLLGRWLTAQLAVGVLFLPWLPNALAQAASNATYFPGRVTWDTVVLNTWRAFAGGDFPHLFIPAQPPPTSAMWLAVVVLGALNPLAHRSSLATPSTRGRLLLVVLLIVPLLLMSLLAWDRPKFAPRYLLPALPAFVVLAALGFDTLLRFRSRLLAGLAMAPLLLIPAIDLLVTAQIYFDPPAARPDLRSVVAYIEANEAPGDALLLVGGHMRPVIDYYYHGRAEVIPLPPDLLPAAQAPLDARVVTQLAGVAANYSRAWLILWQQDIADPTSVVFSELRAHAQRLEVGQKFHEVALLLFDLRSATFTLGPQQPLDVRFADPIRLAGLNLDSNEFTAGQDLNFTLYFESSGPIGRDYRVFTHLVGPDGSPIAQDDHIAGADSYPTSLWSPGTLVRNTFSIHLPPDLSPGLYRLLAGLYDAAGRLSISGDGDAAEIATIVVKP